MEGQNHASGIILRTPQDWLLWSDQFKSKAKRAQIWHYIENHASIDSDNEQTTLTDALKIPEKPKISQFKKKTANGGRSAMEANTLADLIPDDLSTWAALKADYMAERKENELLLKRLDSLQDWIRQTVAIEHLRLHQAFYPYSIFHMERFLYGLRIPPRMEAYSIRMEYKK
jgi:hypothetical protein